MTFIRLDSRENDKFISLRINIEVMECFQGICFLKNNLRFKVAVSWSNHFDILRPIAFFHEIELVVKGCLELGAALAYELQIIILIDLNPNIEHVPVEKKH